MNRRNFLKTAGLTGIGCLLPVGKAEAVTEIVPTENQEYTIGFDTASGPDTHTIEIWTFDAEGNGRRVPPREGEMVYSNTHHGVSVYDGKTWNFWTISGAKFNG